MNSINLNSMMYSSHSMIRRYLLFVLFFLCSAIGWAQTALYKDGIRKGQIKVKFSPEVSGTTLSNASGRSGAGITTGIQAFDAAAQQTRAITMYRLFPYDAKYENKLRKHGLHLWYVVEINEEVDPNAAVAQFKMVKEVTYAEVEHEKLLAPYTVTPYTPGATPMNTLPFNDPMLKDQWHYNNTQQNGFGDADINLFEAWQTTTGASNIIVSVHDQGVDINHKDLKDNIWTNQLEFNGTAGVDDDGNGFVDDIHGWNWGKKSGAIDPEFHGTHVAGTIAAVNNNGIGVGGIAGGNGTGNGVKIMSMQILSGGATEKSFVYAANNGAVISQNSWGYSSPYYYDQSVLDAIDYFVAEAGDYEGSPMKGGIVIFAAGNSNSDSEWYPGYHPSILSVASLGPEWKRAYYSNYGTWVEVAAPGGDQGDYGSKGGVLSTIPKDQYAYMQGTSMACPHVSGIAALALANRNKQLTNDELWNKLVTGVINIDEYNPDYIGKLGSGALDAARAIQNNTGIAPDVISTLQLTGISQEFASISWTVPADGDDVQPISFQLYYSTQPLTAANLNTATKVVLKNIAPAGNEFTHEVGGLLGLTTYYFAVTSTDRWGNVSAISNVLSATTNAGPSIAVDENSQNIALTIDVTNSNIATHDLTILNNAEGILRWEHTMRHTGTALAFNASSLKYPERSSTKSSGVINIARAQVNDAVGKLKSTTIQPVAASFSPIHIEYTSWATNIIGETDLRVPNSAAAKFTVTQSEGFNLTDVRMYLKHDPAKGPVILEIFKGATPVKSNLIYAQEHNNWDTNEAWAYITLSEQLFFESGESFWIVFHVPAGNKFPLGIGYEADPSYSANCFMSFDLGTKWAPLEELLDSKEFAWSVGASSYNQHLGTYLTLEPGSGDVQGNEQTLTTLTATGASLINGSYSANLILLSNDAQNQQLRIPVNLTVTGHQPKIKHTDIADFGNAFIGATKELELLLDNQGYGNFNSPEVSISGAQFELVGDAPWQIKAREQAVLKVRFKPTASGNTNGLLTITDGSNTYEIPLFGVGVQTSKISVTPASQLINDVVIGDEVNATITVKNQGAYPLKYFVPGFDEKEVSANWPSGYHSYGYKFRTNYASETTPLSYGFQDISTTGIKVSDVLKDGYSYYALDMGFEFPFYADKMSTIYIAQKGFTVFDNSVNPVNTPRIPGNEWQPKGYISILGSHFNYVAQGQIFCQVEPDRVTIQYDNVWDGYNVGESITAQMVLYANGDIRFFYDNMGFSESNKQSLAILMEDMQQSDGILVHDYEHPIELYSGLALGFDYPGPDIITHIENGSGIVAPGASVQLNITMNTAALNEGLINRYVNIISNDPAKPQSSALIRLNVTGGGTPQPVVSVDSIDFGNVFQGAVRTSSFTIKNRGTANVVISSIKLKDGNFILTGTPTTIKPGLYSTYKITIPTTVPAVLEDWLTIKYADGSSDVLHITGNVVDAPNINVDLSLLQETLAHGETSAYPFTIENTGLADLEVVVTGDQWLTFDVPVAPSSSTIPAFTYAYEKHNNGEFYQWIDIRKTGTQLPFVINYDRDDYWRELTLPFPIEFYGKTYTEIKVGDNGIISFDEDPDVMMFTDNIPTTIYDGTFLMPYWAFGGFDTMNYPEDEVGIFYQFYDDKIIITWSYIVNNFGGMGDPISAQIFIYKNGTFKFQYKPEEGGVDITSGFTAIGVQENKTNAVSISQHLNLDHGSGLAFILMPAKKHIVATASTLVGQINIDAQNIYGSVYNKTLKIQTNVPGKENLVKPVELTVSGEAIVAAPAPVDFGKKMIAFEWGSPVMNTIDLNLENTGAAPFEITWGEMTDGSSLTLMLLVDGMWGPEWNPINYIWSPWAWEIPTFKIMPGDKMVLRAAFFPSMAGEFTDEAILTTNLGEMRVSLTGIGIEPPSIQVATEPIDVVMNTLTETATRSIAFDNINGLSELTYSISIDYGRVATTPTTTNEKVAKGANYDLIYALEAPVKKVGTPRALGTYNRTITHSERTDPDTYIGTGGTAPFTLATQFNAGTEGFNLSHVETWFRTETLTSGTITVEIRAGGTSVADAVTLAEGSLDFTGSGEDEAGAWYAVKLDQAARIYPNENFYVIVTYPLGIEFPQGTIADAETVANRYYYFDSGDWYNLQEVGGFETMGWLMFAGEETAVNGSWITITSASNGTVTSGEASAIELLFDANMATRGDHVANIVITSNDPNNTTVNVPVSLHVNEAPFFINVPESVVMGEGETTIVKVGVVDVEENIFTVEPKQTYAGITHTFENGVLTLQLSPAFGTAGNHTYKFIATDEHDAVREMNLIVEIEHTNQAPQFIGQERLEYTATGNLHTYEVANYFTDPDGDVLTFSVVTGDLTIADVFASSTQFLVKPMSIGETMLTFNVTDVYGAVTSRTIAIVVNSVLGFEEEKNHGATLYPNPVKETANVYLNLTWKGKVAIEILDASGRQYFTQQIDANVSREIQLNVSTLKAGFYILKAKSADKQAVIKLIKN